ncbi:Vitamin K epoxide reductase [Natrinema pellirubrum DSM 15624]|uniref:Vitamin K epoxide reductase n=1 Tax=Natrinema pellirubrum (strain DSM 15624 / CIP 106293 / JCM 10476 / NCIMB 786 / 157) TaxID=797303 RepID=L0JT57_NATP1|nr:vitamin K epoxide reductase family protein [Natrinema pellirubrum]AGB33998.1 vitamin K epoxide reductase family protein [Natrinema pellirubrum DSM 15624]ELY69183.1 Vitamin K epoxide reductase [Natrinema pellirubrum DSM 15624]
MTNDRNHDSDEELNTGTNDEEAQHPVTDGRGNDGKSAQAGNNGDDGEENDDNGASMRPGDMMLAHPTKEIWPQYAIISLGFWLFVSPPTLGYESALVTWNSYVSGLVLIALAGLTIYQDNGYANYANGFVGLWLVFAPIAFWAPTAAAYANYTLVGIMVITFSVLIVMRSEMEGPTVPPGWSYNPSTGAQRAPLIALGVFGFFASWYMAAYQLGYIGNVWDPLYDPGTEGVLTSQVSAAFPVSDAGLGAVAYSVEALMGFMGDRRRWRTMPWMVAFFGVVVIPLGFVQVLLVIMQPVMVGTWCTLCLLSAFGMLWMISLTVDEVVAMSQYVVRLMRQGDSLWTAFWMGGTISEEESGVDETTTRPIGDSPIREPFWGVSIPWTLLGAMVLGVWLMLSPTIFGTTGLMADSSHIVGSLIVSFTVIATGEPARAVRFLNVPLAGWIIAVPWLLSGVPMIAAVNAVVAGVLVILLSVPRGPIVDRYDGWERYATVESIKQLNPLGS